MKVSLANHSSFRKARPESPPPTGKNTIFVSPAPWTPNQNICQGSPIFKFPTSVPKSASTVIESWNLLPRPPSPSRSKQSASPPRDDQQPRPLPSPREEGDQYVSPLQRVRFSQQRHKSAIE
ncbi:hypothetical protein HPP92_004441 [Vanilla planifolia]|uniref:Uncharacterized protein n=1 Tax=Vanilla planifolia TaxID=51239 RepID=A0A835VCA5_VANPL|nr:hypothetical protein HPP92_004441 [Vanilla planifolia]